MDGRPCLLRRLPIGRLPRPLDRRLPHNHPLTGFAWYVSELRHSPSLAGFRSSSSPTKTSERVLSSNLETENSGCTSSTRSESCGTPLYGPSGYPTYPMLYAPSSRRVEVLQSTAWPSTGRRSRLWPPDKALQLTRRRPGPARASSRRAAGSGVDSPAARRSWHDQFTAACG